jgi:hypothetical protein
MSRKRGPGKPFQPGNHYGRGRPAGSPNKSTALLRVLLDEEGEAIMRTAINLAKEGEPSALKLCLERLVPPCKERSISLQLPGDITTAEGTLGALAAVVDALARGQITPGETLAVAQVLDTCRHAVETQELDRRLTALEKANTEEEASSGGTADLADQPVRDLLSQQSSVPSAAIDTEVKELGNA